MVERTDVEKKVINAIWRGLRDLEILDELYSIRELGLTGSDREQTEIESHIRRIRKEISEARELAPAFAQHKFLDGWEWGAVIAALERPCLLSSFEITEIAQRAHAAVEAEQGGAA